MQAREFDKTKARVDAQIAEVRKYQKRTGKPVVGVIPEGGIGASSPELAVAARYYVAQQGIPAYSTFARAAQAYGRAVRYWGFRDETRT
jgi:acyl-CoA synthetase (NDP forming)